MEKTVLEKLFFLWDLKFHCRVHNSLPLYPILNKISPVHTLPPLLFNLVIYQILKTYVIFLVQQVTEVKYPLIINNLPWSVNLHEFSTDSV